MGKPIPENGDQTSSLSTHFSHLHPLQLINTPINGSSTCSACKLDAPGVVYSCATCPFVLHQNCYKLPQQIMHEFDKTHVLVLQPKPVYPEGIFMCDACGKQGDGFSYHCSLCGTDLHSICATLPLVLTHQCHQHELRLLFKAPYQGQVFSCDICRRNSSKTWLYRCEVCEFDVHISCLTKIPSVFSHQHQIIPQIHTLPGSISLPPNVSYHPQQWPQPGRIPVNSYPAPQLPYNTNQPLNRPPAENTASTALVNGSAAVIAGILTPILTQVIAGEGGVVAADGMNMDAGISG